MTMELWGTFSVKDHLVHRAFVADVLLYDRLLIPTLPDDEDPATWKQDWDIEKQRIAFDVLEELAIPIPWTQQYHKTWEAYSNTAQNGMLRVDMAEAIADRVRFPEQEALDLQRTRMVLADDPALKDLHATSKARPGSVVETVVAYPDYQAFSADVKLPGIAGKAPAARNGTLSIFGWKIPLICRTADGETDDRKLLQSAVKLARKTEFIEMRGDFYKWLSDMFAAKVSPEDARADLEKRITEYDQFVRAEGLGALTRWAIKIAGAFDPLGVVNEIFSGPNEDYFGLAPARNETPLRLRPAAMFHDIRRLPFG